MGRLHQPGNLLPQHHSRERAARIQRMLELAKLRARSRTFGNSGGWLGAGNEPWRELLSSQEAGPP